MSSIPCPVLEAARRYCGHTALIDRDRAHSFDSFDRQTLALAGELSKLGYGEGDRIAFVCDNSALMVLALCACVRSGIVLSPLNIRWPEAMIVRALNLVKPKAVVSPYTYGTYDCLDPARLEGVIDSPRTSPIVDSPIMRAADQPAGIVFTSGSSGDPKAALLTLGNFYFNAEGSNDNIPFGPADRWLLSLPLYHVGGLGILFRALLGGGSVVLPERGMELAESIQRYRVTHLSLVSTQFRRLLEDESALRALSARIKAVLLGGSAIPDSLIRRACSYGLPVYKSYGLTEMASQVTTTAPDDLPIRTDTAGRPLPYRDLRIGDDNQIFVKGKTRFAGYVDGDSLETPFDREGWFATGDTGRLNADGYLTVYGRRDNMFVSGGENIQPEQIERALCSLDDIEEAIVVPAPDPEFDFRPVAFIRTVGNAKLDRNRLRTALEPLLPRFAIPERFLSWPDIDSLSGLKPSRASFAALVESEDTTRD